LLPILPSQKGKIYNKRTKIRGGRIWDSGKGQLTEQKGGGDSQDDGQSIRENHFAAASGSTQYGWV
jgi:hypothetical protein